MVYSRLLPGKKRLDPLDGFKPADASAAIPPPTDPKFEPPPGARTFAAHDALEARRICAARPHVIIREDPMFGRRGYAKEILAEASGGYLVLVIAFAMRKDFSGNWVEPTRPRDADRRYWEPGKVEFV